MNDFLTNLAARTLGIDKPVRPRMASLFETAAAPEPVVNLSASHSLPSTPALSSIETVVREVHHTQSPQFPAERRVFVPATNAPQVEAPSPDAVHITNHFALPVQNPVAQPAAPPTATRQHAFGVPVPPRRTEKQTISAVPTSEPSIKIHIGRIEVQANFPAVPVSQPRRNAAPAPSVSLDDYLRQHNGSRS